MSTPGHNITIATITNSGASALAVKKEALDCATHQLNMKHLDDMKLSQSDHQFGTLDKASKTIGAVRVPFAFRTGENEESVEFHVRLDIISGDLPVLIGLHFLHAMKATLKFR